MRTILFATLAATAAGAVAWLAGAHALADLAWAVAVVSLVSVTSQL